MNICMKRLVWLIRPFDHMPNEEYSYTWEKIALSGVENKYGTLLNIGLENKITFSYKDALKHIAGMFLYRYQSLAMCSCNFCGDNSPLRK